MFKHVLIATDGSELAKKAVEHGLLLAKALGSKATAVTVTEPWDAVVVAEAAVVFSPDHYDESVAASAANILRGVTEAAARVRVSCETVHFKDQFPAEGIVEAAKRLGCDLIVMASHGRRGMSRLLLGSQANKVLTHSTIPVLIFR
jgi:nucleotide-binding universal stress UspA family protein